MHAHADLDVCLGGLHRRHVLNEEGRYLWCPCRRVMELMQGTLQPEGGGEAGAKLLPARWGWHGLQHQVARCGVRRLLRTGSEQTSRDRIAPPPALPAWVDDGQDTRS